MSHLVYITLFGETDGVTLSKLGCTTGIKGGSIVLRSLGIFKVYSSIVCLLSIELGLSVFGPPGSSAAKGMECGRLPVCLSLNANHKLLEAFCVKDICQNLCHL